MNQNHPEGYWVKQLTDEQATDLLIKIVSQKANKKFQKVLKIERKETSIEITY